MVGYRNVPVCAGSIPQWKNSRFLVMEDLRACGENSVIASDSTLTVRASPHTRGKRIGDSPEIWDVRNIPAHAGKTRIRKVGQKRSSEQPRACGENHAYHSSADDTTRNIPVYAGKTPHSRRSLAHQPEYPRIRGENPCPGGARWRGGGTSPRMRGKQLDNFKKENDRRNISAYAGKTHRLSPAPANT